MQNWFKDQADGRDGTLGVPQRAGVRSEFVDSVDIGAVSSHGSHGLSHISTPATAFKTIAAAAAKGCHPRSAALVDSESR